MVARKSKVAPRYAQRPVVPEDERQKEQEQGQRQEQEQED